MKITKKIYLTEPFRTACDAKIIDVTSDAICTDQTVAFAESGGQDSDRGIITVTCMNGEIYSVNFISTYMGYGKVIVLPDFPVLQIQAPIFHRIASDQIHLFQPGEACCIEIDATHRAAVTVHHTGLHLVLMCAEEVRPGLIGSVIGCHIAPNHARIDFVANRFSGSEIAEIATKVDHLSQSDSPIETSMHPLCEEAKYWSCGSFQIPCGGTHLPSCKFLGPIKLSRKKLGVGKERLIASFPQAILPMNLYYSGTF